CDKALFPSLHHRSSDARRGIALDSNFFTASPSAPFKGTGIFLDGAATPPLPRRGVFASYRFILNSSTSGSLNWPVLVTLTHLRMSYKVHPKRAVRCFARSEERN